MAAKSNCIKLTNLPADVKERPLKYALSSYARSSQAGRLKTIDLKQSDEGLYAIASFDQHEDVDKILSNVQNGNPISVNNQELSVTKYDDSLQGKAEVQSGKSKKESSESKKHPVGRTIKASVNETYWKDKDKDKFILYLENRTENQVEDDSSFIDSINGKVYASFTHAKDAEEACRLDLDDHDFIETIEMATMADFEFFDDHLWVCGPSVKSLQSKRLEFEKYIKVKAKQEIKINDILQEKGESSAIIVFDEVNQSTIAKLTWQLRSSFKDEEIITAPVYETSSLIVTKSPVDEDYLKDYFSNYRSRGGPIKSVVTKEGTDDIIVTFKSSKSLLAVMEKREHVLGGHTLVVGKYYSCLYDAACEHTHTVDGARKRVSGKKGTAEETHDLEKKDVVMFKQTDMLSSLQEKFEYLEINLEENKLKISGGREKDIKAAGIELMKMRQRIQTRQLSLSNNQISVLSSEHAKEMIQLHIREVGKQAALNIVDGYAYVYFQSPTDPQSVKEAVEQHVEEKKKTFSSERAGKIFSYPLGQEYLSSFSEARDGRRRAFLVKYNASTNSATIIAPHTEMQGILKDIDAFASANATEVKNVAFSPGQLKFAQRFKAERLKKVRELATSLKIHIEDKHGCFQFEGKKEDIRSIEKNLIELRNSIYEEDFQLDFFAIKEYLESEGKSKVSALADRLNCLIDAHAQTTAGRNDSGVGKKQSPVLEKPQCVAQVELQSGSVLHIMQGDLLGLRVETIVNPVDKSLHLGKTGLGKAILDKGGSEIQSELKQGFSEGCVIETGAGHLTCCKIVLHVVLDNFNSGVDSITGAVKACFDLATKTGYKSIAFPTLGTGKVFGYPDLSVCVEMIRAIKHCTDVDGFQGEVYVSDHSPDILSKLIRRCDTEFPEKMEKISEPKRQEAQTSNKMPESQASKPSVPKKPPVKQRTQRTNRTLGKFNIKIHSGEITKWKVDAIVISADQSLDLSKGALPKTVLKYGGQEIQDELQQSYPDGIQRWGFAKSSGGQLKCKHVFFACIPHWKHTGMITQMQKCFEDILEAADDIPATSIAFAALGTGNLKFPIDAVAKAMSGALVAFSQHTPNTSLKSVDIVVFSRDPQCSEILEAFQSHVLGSDDEDQKGKTSAASANASESDEENDNDNSLFKGPKKFFKSAFGKMADFFKGDGSGPLTIKKGDITQEQCDVIVNSIKESMDLAKSGAVCKSLSQKCGSALQDELNAKQAEFQQNRVVATSAPNLHCKEIYHISRDAFSRCWDKGVCEALEQAAAAGHKSVAIPLLGASPKKSNIDEIKDQIEKGVVQFQSQGTTKLKDIRLVIFFREWYDHFTQDDSQQDTAGARSKAQGVVKKVPLPKVSKSADFKLFAKDAAHAKKIKEELKKSFKAAFTEFRESLDIALNKEQKHDLLQLACTKYVWVEFEDKKVVLKSFFPKEEILSKLLSFAQEAGKHQFSFTLAIQWQFQDSKNNWRDFEAPLNIELETSYQKKVKGCVVKDARGRSYEVDFKSMTEALIDEAGNSKERFEIRRIDTRKGALPKKWDSLHSDKNLNIVLVKKGSAEYKRVEDLFVKGGVTKPVKEIQRIENKTLYQQYDVQKKLMDKRNGKGFQNEKKLFHGTDPSVIPQINENGFSRNYSGVHATAYGEGTYFAVTSSYSQSYAKQVGNDQYMYLVKVLVGKTTRSSQGMKFLPNQPGVDPPTPFDSGTDGGNQMYIIFHDAYTYPEYLIRF